MDDGAGKITPGQSLAELVGSRLCHDLSNPLGAIGNGVELIDMTGATQGPEMDLIREAIGNAQAQLRFFRLAFGAAAPDQQISHREAEGTLTGYFAGGRIAPRWQGARDLPRQQVKLAYLMALCAETALPMGGDVVLAGTGEDWRLEATGPRLRIDEGLWSVLRFGRSGGHSLRPSEVQFIALHRLVEEMERTINFVADAEAGQLRIAVV